MPTQNAKDNKQVNREKGAREREGERKREISNRKSFGLLIWMGCRFFGDAPNFLKQPKALLSFSRRHCCAFHDYDQCLSFNANL